jgi:SAM-dependent methyltransferase
VSDKSRQWDDVWEAHKYESDYMLRWYSYLNRVAEGSQDKKKVLEIGCGSGGGVALFADYGHSAFGVDISPVAIERSRKIYKNVTFICEDLFNLKFEKESFDIIFNSGLIEHFPYPKNIETIKIMSKLLRPGGALIISVPNRLCLWYRLGKKILEILNRWPYGYEDSYSPALFKKYLNEVTELSLMRIFGLQIMPMFALPNFVLFPEKARKLIAFVEEKIPLRQYYSYAIIAECKKKE